MIRRDRGDIIVNGKNTFLSSLFFLFMIYIGTSGWNYAHWRDKFYPKKIKPSDFLKFYSRHFKTTEINYSFYRLPKTSTYQNWYNQTPKKFIFAVKASRFITHIKRLKNTKTALKIFLENASSLKEKLGPILFQFPPNFKATEENINRLENFLEIGFPPCLEEYPAAPTGLVSDEVGAVGAREKKFRPLESEYSGSERQWRKSLKAGLVGKWAFEFRHSSWCNEKIYKLLRKYNAAWVIADSPNYPILRRGSGQEAEAITADFIYIRMHGSQILFGSKYTKKELGDLAQKIKKWQKKTKDIFVYFNNDFAGYAIENAQELSYNYRK